LFAAWFVPTPSGATDTTLVRSEVAQIKKCLVSAEAALGVPAEYLRTTEDFSLPTEGSGKTGAGKWNPISSSVQLRFEGKAAKEGEADLKKAGEEYQKKIAAATEKGDYEEVSRLSVEYSAQMTKSTSKVMGGQKEPLSARIELNAGASAQIDPDAVVVEKSGVLALKRTRGDESSSRIEIDLYVDPVALKDTKEAVMVSISQPEAGIDRKLGVYTVSVHLEGPSPAVVAWLKAVNTGVLLAIIKGEAPAATKPAK
jgi:hypothetical protein